MSFHNDPFTAALGINFWNFLYFNYLQMRNVFKTKKYGWRVSCQTYLLALADDLHFQMGVCSQSKNLLHHVSHVDVTDADAADLSTLWQG